MLKWLGNNWLIIAFLVISACFRAIGISDFDYNHDELSALLRTRFSNLDALIAKGVAIDGHPIFTQLFLWVYVHFFGIEPWVNKLPFIVSSLVVVWLCYDIGKRLFSPSAGNFAALLFGTLQFALIYSQWARPYAFGLLFSTAAFWSLVRFRESKSQLWVFAFAFAAALAGLTHYFALVQVIVVSVFWWVFQSKSDKKGIFWAAVLAFLLFLPHWNITMAQLEIGGIGDWLQPARPDFWIKLLRFSAHYSVSIPAVLLVSILLTFRKIPNHSTAWIARFAMLAASILPFTAAYYYSKNVSALLHFGTVVFSLPILVLLVSSFINLSKFFERLLLLILLLLASIQVWFGRNHWLLNERTEYMSPFEKRIKMQPMPPMIYDLRRDAIGLLAENSLIDTTEAKAAQTLMEQGEFGAYFNRLNSNEVMVVVSTASKQETLSAALWNYRKLKGIFGYQTGAAYLLSNEPDSSRSPFSTDTNIWVANNGRLTVQNPYTTAFSKTIYPKCGRSTWVGVEYIAKDKPDAALAVVISDGEKEIAVNYAELNVTFVEGDSLQRVAWMIDGCDFQQYPMLQLKAFIWNKGQTDLIGKQLYFGNFYTNFWKYKLFDEIE